MSARVDVALTHRTSYAYDRPIRLGPQTVRLRPAPHSRTAIRSYGMTVEPAGHFLNWQQDPFGNYLARLVFPEPTDRFEVTVDLIADLTPVNPFDFFLDEEAFFAPFAYAPDLAADLAPYLAPVPGGPLMEALAEEERRRLAAAGGAMRTIDFLVEVNGRLKDAIAYTIRMEPGVQTPEETLERRLGSCRDSAWALVALLRRLGVAARFVSGYLIQLTADAPSRDGPSGPAADFTDLHAWTEAYVPGAGWIGLDPTSGLFAAEGHVPLAATPSPGSAAAISGGHEPCDVSFDFDMRIVRIDDPPRPSKPMSEAAWAALDDAGRRIDRLLAAGDVRLTVGGEPTFVASADRDADEWNIDAVGPTKRVYADRLIRTLRDRFAPGGALHYGQGKWYPGESLPRWAFSLYWRRDGAPLWRDAGLIAREDGPRDATAADAQRFAEALCRQLGVDTEFAAAAYEDPAAYLFREASLPPDVDPRDNRLEDPEERVRLARVFDRGLTTPAAFVLPLQAEDPASAGAAGAPRTRTTGQPPQAAADGDAARLGPRRAFRWRSDRWRARRGALFLHPGDSPAGFRLPLTGLAWVDPRDVAGLYTLDPFAERGALPPTPQVQGPAPAESTTAAAAAQAPAAAPATGPATGGTTGAGPGEAPPVRTALTIEPRDGVLCVFAPPVRSADEYVDLVAAIEAAAAETGLPVQLEGYPPPDDPRLAVVKVTPDPGVVEVNIHPARSWSEQVGIVEALYDAADACGLDASKFAIDGRPAGSGGGAHLVLGGPTPADSPFLRRPDVLASMLRFWQNHPSLSYYFSGLFIGATSQAPRIDEARHESLYELEIALAQIPEPRRARGDECPPWLVDRLFRHLLTDVSGNTHRAEICIDKLYSPDGPTGRLGLVELRAFEMPPHPRMNLAQSLLVRALIAWFWRAPYGGRLRRWGAALHDRFMLPSVLRRDLEEVLAEAGRGTGVRLDAGWFDAQHEFRFPRLGAIEAAGVGLELRAALEPWPALGEEGAGGGVARFVDSSLERVEARVTGLADPKRYAVACNGIALPLAPVGESAGAGAPAVAGVRFRSWQPPSCLHPTIRPQGPLRFDIVDRWAGRSVGGCAYHAAHPGGRNFETRPVNALEAEGRRRARFFPFASAPGALELRAAPPNPDYPTTLDLRRVGVD